MKRSLDRARIEQHLHVDEQLSVSEWTKRYGVPLDAWPRHPGARGWLELALGRAVDRALKTDRARSRSAALQLVCDEIGLNYDTIRKRSQRNRKVGDRVSP